MSASIVRTSLRGIEAWEDISVRQKPFCGRTATQSAGDASSPLRSLWPRLGQGASQGKESVLADLREGG